MLPAPSGMEVELLVAISYPTPGTEHRAMIDSVSCCTYDSKFTIYSQWQNIFGYQEVYTLTF